MNSAVWGVLIISGTTNSYITDKFAIHSFFWYLTITIGYYIVSAICFYCSYFFVAPRLIVKKQYLLSILLALLALVVVIIARYVLEFSFLKPVLHFDNYKGGIPDIKYYISNIFYYYFPSYFVYGLMYFFALSWYDNNQHRQEQQREQLNTELAFLRSQINPHFLFNTINDIYSLTYNKSEQAPEALLKLSVMLRYMLREGNEEFMPLNREVEYLENMIALQRIGVKYTAYINFVQEGYIGEQLVASLLFVAFAENAFKHGIWNDEANPLEISIKASNTQLTFKTRNKKNNSLKDDTGGIGLANVQRRLQLLYPDKHKLTIHDNDEFYKVNLLLNLNR